MERIVAETLTWQVPHLDRPQCDHDIRHGWGVRYGGSHVANALAYSTLFIYELENWGQCMHDVCRGVKVRGKELKNPDNCVESICKTNSKE